MLAALYTGNTLHLSSPLEFLRDPLGWLELVSATATTLTVTPYFAINHCRKALVAEDGAAERDLELGRLRTWFVGSDPIDHDGLMAFQQLLVTRGLRAETFLPCYGMAEAVLMISGIARDARPSANVRDGRALVSVGRLAPGFEVRVTREDGSACRNGELGQLELRGGTLIGAYFDEHPETFLNADGYFATGDLGYRLGDELYIAGRMGDRIKVNGRTLVAGEFERAVEALPFVGAGRSVVFQLEDRIKLLVELPVADATPSHRGALVDAIVAGVGVKLAADDVSFIRRGQLKRTTSGKLRRHAIVAAFLTNDFDMIEAASAHHEREIAHV